MAEYQLTATDIVIRTKDGAYIPNDPSNSDRIEYDKWLAAGGVPDPYVPPEDASPDHPVRQQPSPEVQVLFDHEKRLLDLEARPGPPLPSQQPMYPKLADFVAKMVKPPPAGKK